MGRTKPADISRAIRGDGRALLKWAKQNGWEATLTKSNHLRLTHPLVGFVIGSCTSHAGRERDMAAIRRRMRAANIPIKE